MALGLLPSEIKGATRLSEEAILGKMPCDVTSLSPVFYGLVIGPLPPFGRRDREGVFTLVTAHTL